MLTIAIALSCLILAYAAWRDVALRTIPDACSIALLVLGILVRAPLGPTAVLTSLGVALLLFVLLVLLHARGLLGGGDVKLAAALAVGLSPLATYRFLFLTVVIGGVLGVLYLLVSRHMPVPALQRGRALPARVWAVESRRIRGRVSLPYGLAIAAAGIWTLLHTA
ncbi:MAG: prepilin peptidase [Geminicoccaceae bacterium]